MQHPRIPSNMRPARNSHARPSRSHARNASWAARSCQQTRRARRLAQIARKCSLRGRLCTSGGRRSIRQRRAPSNEIARGQTSRGHRFPHLSARRRVTFDDAGSRDDKVLDASRSQRQIKNVSERSRRRAHAKGVARYGSSSAIRPRTLAAVYSQQANWLHPVEPVIDGHVARYSVAVSVERRSSSG